MEDDFFLILKGLAVLVLVIVAIQGLSDDDCDVVSDLSPYVVVDLSCGCDSFKDLILGDELHRVTTF